MGSDTSGAPSESEGPAPESRPSHWPFIAAGAILLAAGLVANEFVLGAWLTRGGRITNVTSRIVLAFFDLTVIAFGVLLVVRRRNAPWRQMLLSVVATIVALGLAEGGLRLWFGVRSRLVPQDREIAAMIGWRPTANVSIEGEQPGFGHVRYHTTHDGFRVFGDPRSTKTKVLVLGDSFTEAMMITDGETYYERLARARPDVEVFAIGGGGYGTLQEYMLLDQWVDVIKPDWVLLQMHPNDLINNSHALESRSSNNNNQMTRPYWEDGRIVMRFPVNDTWGPLYNLAARSYVIRLLNLNLYFLRAESPGAVERGLTRTDPDVQAATRATVELLTMMRSRAKVPVVAFSVKPDAYFPFWWESDVCRRAGVTFIPGVGEAVDAADLAGQSVTGKPFDAHWNGAGHAIAARVLTEWLTRGGR